MNAPAGLPALESWHDTLIYGFHLRAADPSAGDWRHELWLDVDWIAEWICLTDGGGRFRVAPATVVFHKVTDLSLAVDFGDSGLSTAINEMSVHALTREAAQPTCAIAPVAYYRWNMTLNLPAGGRIRFGASAYTRILRAAPVETDQPRLDPILRVPFIMGSAGVG